MYGPKAALQWLVPFLFGDWYNVIRPRQNDEGPFVKSRIEVVQSNTM